MVHDVRSWFREFSHALYIFAAVVEMRVPFFCTQAHQARSEGLLRPAGYVCSSQTATCWRLSRSTINHTCCRQIWACQCHPWGSSTLPPFRSSSLRLCGKLPTILSVSVIATDVMPRRLVRKRTKISRWRETIRVHTSRKAGVNLPTA